MKKPVLSPRIAPAIAVAITHPSDSRPNCASAAPASTMVSPGTGRPVFSRKTPTNTTAYPYRANRSTSHSGTLTPGRLSLVPSDEPRTTRQPKAVTLVLHNHDYVPYQ